MKKTACIYTSNTGVGLVADVDLLQDLLHEYYDVDVLFFNWKNEQVYTTSESTKYDLGTVSYTHLTLPTKRIV